MIGILSCQSRLDSIVSTSHSAPPVEVPAHILPNLKTVAARSRSVAALLHGRALERIVVFDGALECVEDLEASLVAPIVSSLTIVPYKLIWTNLETIGWCFKGLVALHIITFVVSTDWSKPTRSRR